MPHILTNDVKTSKLRARGGGQKSNSWDCTFINPPLSWHIIHETGDSNAGQTAEVVVSTRPVTQEMKERANGDNKEARTVYQ